MRSILSVASVGIFLLAIGGGMLGHFIGKGVVAYYDNKLFEEYDCPDVVYETKKKTETEAEEAPLNIPAHLTLRGKEIYLQNHLCLQTCKLITSRYDRNDCIDKCAKDIYENE